MRKQSVFSISDSERAFLNLPESGRSPIAATYSVYIPGEGDYHFNLGVSSAQFCGKLYAFWKSSPRDEDTAEDTVVRYSYSGDGGKNWCESKILCQAGADGFLRAPGSCYCDGRRLIVYVQKVSTYYGEGDTFTECYMTEDGEHFSGPAVLMRQMPEGGEEVLPAAASGMVLRCRSGRLIMGFQGNIDRYHRRQFVTQMYYADCPDGISGWRKADFPLLERPGEGQGAEIEPGYYQRKDGAIVVALRDMNGGGFVLASVSYDNGEHYTLSQSTNLPDSGSMQCGGTLPGGTAFFVNNPNQKERIPLALHLSKEGELFDKSVVLRGREDLQKRRYVGKYKNEGYSYPSAGIYDNCLYVFYAVNKEDIEVTVIPCPDLKHMV